MSEGVREPEESSLKSSTIPLLAGWVLVLTYLQSPGLASSIAMKSDLYIIPSVLQFGWGMGLGKVVVGVFLVRLKWWNQRERGPIGPVAKWIVTSTHIPNLFFRAPEAGNRENRESGWVNLKCERLPGGLFQYFMMPKRTNLRNRGASSWGIRSQWVNEREMNLVCNKITQ